MIKIAVLGYGNIGSGVVSVLLDNKEVIQKTAGEEIVPACVLDLREFPGDVMETYVVHNIQKIVEDPELYAVVETMGGTKPAYEFVKACLLAGKHVVTSNKELVAAHGAELLRIAREKNVNFLFEASVGGAIPIIRPLSSCITADSITEITGILNGTTNYMLTNMAQSGMEYEEVLRQAQELGYAERHPEADVEGLDACRKIAILSSMAFGKQVCWEKIPTEGITSIDKKDIEYAKKLGMTIKLFGTSQMNHGRVSAMVSPVLIRPEHPLYAVNGVMNAILVRGEKMGDFMFYGAGAGKLPTATAVIADLIASVLHPQGGELRGYCEEEQPLGNLMEEERHFLVRVSGPIRQSVQEILGAKKAIASEDGQEYAFVTRKMSERQLTEQTAAIAGYRSRLRIVE